MIINRRSPRQDDLERFYELLQKLESSIGGDRRLSECSGRDCWPQRGVYFIQEPGENRFDTGNGRRVVRVGTHALKRGAGTKLWTRLSQHKGVVSSGGGNHRGSIFRLIIGAAIQEKEESNIPTWGCGSSAPRDIRDKELELERAVSRKIGEMHVLWLCVNDEPGPESTRGYIERNSIALLSNFAKEPLDPPSPSWLGHSCDRRLVRESGLWNSNHVAESYDPDFLTKLDSLIKRAEEMS